MEWIINILRTVAFFLDGIVYPLIDTVYELFESIANTSIFTEEIIDIFASKVYALLGIFMLFKVSFSIMTYIVNPDEFADKNKGFSKLISNIIITLALLLFTPWIFSQAMDIQRIILKDNIIGKIFSTQEQSSLSTLNSGQTMAYETFSAFYKLNESAKTLCDGLEKGTADDSLCRNYMNNSKNYDNYKTELQNSYIGKNLHFILKDYNLLNQRSKDDEYVMSYMPFISTICGGFIAWILIIFCFDVAVRSVKLGFLRMIAPVPIVSRVDPKKGKETFDKWMKVCISTYLDLFIRLLAINFALFVITQVVNMDFVDQTTGLPTEVNAFVKIFIIMGALLFAKQLPKLLEDLTGAKLDGKFTLNPLKKLEEVPILGKPASSTLQLAGRTAGNVAKFAGGAALRIASTPLRYAGDKIKNSKVGTSFSKFGRNVQGIYNNIESFGAEIWEDFADKHKYMGEAGNKIGADFRGTMNKIGADASSTIGGKLNKNRYEKQIEANNRIVDKFSALKKMALDDIAHGKAGELSEQYNLMQAKIDRLANEVIAEVNRNDSRFYDTVEKTVMEFDANHVAHQKKVTTTTFNQAKYDEAIAERNRAVAEHDRSLASARAEFGKWYNKEAVAEYVENGINNLHTNGNTTLGYEISADFKTAYAGYGQAASLAGQTVETKYSRMKDQSDGLNDVNNKLKDHLMAIKEAKKK